MNIENKSVILKKCEDKAIRLISNITGETEEEVIKRYKNDDRLYYSLRHLKRMYYEFETNESFRHKKYLAYIKDSETLEKFKMEYACEWIGQDDLSKGDVCK